MKNDDANTITIDLPFKDQMPDRLPQAIYSLSQQQDCPYTVTYFCVKNL